jgi:hypothetical protein
MILDHFDSTNTMKSCRMKLYKSKRSVVSCYEAKKPHSAIEIRNQLLLRPSNLAFQTGDNELNHGLRAKYEMKTHKNCVWCMSGHP